MLRGSFRYMHILSIITHTESVVACMLDALLLLDVFAANILPLLALVCSIPDTGCCHVERTASQRKQWSSMKHTS
jgi:hypothetical protein